MNNSTHHNRLLILTSELQVAGGLERMVASLANLLAEKGYDITLLITGESSESFYPLHPHISITTIPLHFGIGDDKGYIGRKWRFVKDVSRLRKRVRSLHAQLVITTDYPQTVALRILPFSCSVLHWQLSSFLKKKSTLWERLFRLAMKRVQKIICLNGDELLLAKQYNSNAVVIPNFTMLPSVSSQRDTKTILTIARLSEEKGIDHLLLAAKGIAEKHPDWKWLLIGRGPMERVVREFIKKHGLAHQLILKAPEPGSTDQWYRQASLYVSTSRMESFGMALLESMAAGVPCIACDCPTGPKYLIRNEVDGLLVANENLPQLLDAIDSLVKNEERRKMLGSAAAEAAKKYSAENIFIQWKAVLDSPGVTL